MTWKQRSDGAIIKADGSRRVQMPIARLEGLFAEFGCGGLDALEVQSSLRGLVP
jgi:hypothetical protein